MSAPSTVVAIDIAQTYKARKLDDTQPFFGVFVNDVPAGFGGSISLRIGSATAEPLLVVAGWRRVYAQPVREIYVDVVPDGSTTGNAHVELALQPMDFAGGGGGVTVTNINQALADNLLGNTRGSLAERSAAGWTALVPGTAGLPLVSGGAGADPAYAQVAAAGIAAGAATLAKLDTTGAAATILKSPGGAGAPTWATLGAVIDAFIGGAVADGDILFRAAGAWVRLGIGAAAKAILSDGSGPAWSYPTDLTNLPVKLKQFSETPSALGNLGATPALDLSTATVFTGTNNVAPTFTFTNAIAAKGNSFTLILTNGGAHAVTWPASVKWAGGSAPALTAAGVDVLTFSSPDGGTTWYGFLGGLAFA